MPFDAGTVIDNLLRERYPIDSHESAKALKSNEALRRLYYAMRPLFPDSVRRGLQRLYLRDWQALSFPRWPVDTSVEELVERLLLLSLKASGLTSVPFIWFWPDGASASAILTHDVETTAGLNFIPRLMDLDARFGIRSAYQLVPEERYQLERGLISRIRERHCEVNVHGLNHNENLFGDRRTFLKRCSLINRYLEEFGSEGFRSPCMYRNLDWMNALNIQYDMSVPNVAHLEPQRGGCCTVFPYFADRILELPLTTIQDYSLFYILGDYSIEIWKTQIDLIRRKHGLISFIIHPDYVLNKRAFTTYTALLAYLTNVAREKDIWIALPGEVNRWWRQRNEMRLVLKDGKWQIEGEGRERARIAVACIQGDQIEYRLGDSGEAVAGQEGLVRGV
ncbi:MAG: hypothetical protein ACKV22_31815 [Bryobacteraceae bacterium]